MSDQKQSQIYVIFSVDTEHDIIRRNTTRSAGWSMGVPLLFDVFDASGLRGKVCWLIEYNIKDGVVAANPRSPFYCQEFSELIGQIKNRGDELGLHPTVYDWLGGEGEFPASAYNDPNLWDMTKRYHDPEFVINLITSGTREVKKACGVNLTGCRTCGCGWYATHLATALQRNEIGVDSSVPIGRPWQWIRAPNAYYPAEDDIRNKANTKTGVLEIPITGYICSGWSQLLLKLRIWYLLRQRQPVFLSFYIHNWQAITTNGIPDKRFLESLSSFLRFLRNHGAHFLRWTEAYKLYEKFAEQTHRILSFLLPAILTGNIAPELLSLFDTKLYF